MLGVRWEAVELAPLKDAALKKPKEFPFLGKDLVLKRPFTQNFRWEKIREQGSGQERVIGSGIEGCGAEFGPAFAAACWKVIHRPRFDCGLVVAQNVHHGSMFGKDRLEGRDMTGDVVFDHAKVPLAEKTLQRLGKVRAHRPRCTKGGGTWSVFPSTRRWCCRWHEVTTKYGKVLGCWQQDDEGHSTSEGHPHWTEAFWWFQIWLWYWSPSRE